MHIAYAIYWANKGEQWAKRKLGLLSLIRPYHRIG